MAATLDVNEFVDGEHSDHDVAQGTKPQKPTHTLALEPLDEEVENPDAILDVDFEAHLRWLETGEGDPWVASRRLPSGTRERFLPRRSYPTVPKARR
jgi:hypothetical protein